uniref:Uncharacterized protein n=1 Tax=Glossina palpalis gambiensis TaxID=67801 RepID=A0A1B0BHV9_9MUSC
MSNELLKEKKVNLLEDTFQSITQPLKRIIKKHDKNNSTPLTSSLTNDSIENHNNGGDEGDNDDGEFNNEINDVNNIDYNDVEVQADNDVAMGNNDVEMPTYNSLSNYRYKPNEGQRRKTKTNLLKHGKSRSSAKTKKNLLKYGKSGRTAKMILRNTPLTATASTHIVHHTENSPYVDCVGNQEEGGADFHNPEENMIIDETSLESSSLLNNNSKNKKSVVRTVISNEKVDKIYHFNVDVRGNWRHGNNKLKFNRDNTINIGNIKWAMTPDPKDAVTKAYVLRKNDVLTDSVNNLTTTYTSKMDRIEDDMRQFRNSYDLQIWINQLINANESYMNKIAERFDKIEEHIFKWFGVKQPQEKYGEQLNSMRDDLIKLQTTLTSNVEEDVKLIEQTVKAYLHNENNEFINKIEERFQIIEDYLFKSIGLKQRQQQDKDIKRRRTN